MKIAQLSSNRALGIPEVDHHLLSIKFKKHRSQRFCFAAKSLTPKMYVELPNSKKCKDQRRLLKISMLNHNLCIKRDPIKI